MACGEEVTVETRYWGWCRKWGVPYPCRKTKLSIRYRYEFTPWRPRITWPFRCRHEGCCGDNLYSWTRWCWRGTGNGAWNELTPRVEHFKKRLYPTGKCPFS